ncbi:nucleoside diphosphate kinase regulator [Halpernia sp.]|uniref:nucleoside diphosphate kinase regulator n=1 Tax=Halpernia sp. TaxID=2782209 RepID=UPI003A8EA5A0
MNQITMNKQDFSRIRQSISQAKKSNTIKIEEAEILLKELNSAKLLNPEEISADLVTMNTEVEILFKNTNKSATIKIVYPQDANIKERKISIFSPVASALIGYKVGDEINWKLPSGETKIVITKIIYQPEAAGNFDQ